MSKTQKYEDCPPKEGCHGDCENCHVFNAMLMEGDRREAHDQDVAFMRYWERKGENW